VRIISQDGTIDIPYSLAALSIGCNATQTAFNIYCRSKLLGDKPCVVASYLSEEKATRAITQLHAAYMGTVLMQNVDVSEEAVDILKKHSKNAIISHIEPPANQKIEFINKGYFRFPADDEIEV